jgi:hypothetical protein
MKQTRSCSHSTTNVCPFRSACGLMFSIRGLFTFDARTHSAAKSKKQTAAAVATQQPVCAHSGLRAQCIYLYSMGTAAIAHEDTGVLASGQRLQHLRKCARRRDKAGLGPSSTSTLSNCQCRKYRSKSHSKGMADPEHEATASC